MDTSGSTVTVPPVTVPKEPQLKLAYPIEWDSPVHKLGPSQNQSVGAIIRGEVVVQVAYGPDGTEKRAKGVSITLADESGQTASFMNSSLNGQLVAPDSNAAAGYFLETLLLGASLELDDDPADSRPELLFHLPTGTELNGSYDVSTGINFGVFGDQGTAGFSMSESKSIQLKDYMIYDLSDNITMQTRWAVGMLADGSPYHVTQQGVAHPEELFPPVVPFGAIRKPPPLSTTNLPIPMCAGWEVPLNSAKATLVLRLIGSYRYVSFDTLKLLEIEAEAFAAVVFTGTSAVGYVLKQLDQAMTSSQVTFDETWRYPIDLGEVG